MDHLQEAGAQLVLEAFLQKVINGGGRVTQEYPFEQRRADLSIQWPQGRRWHAARASQHVIECRTLRSGRGLNSTVEKDLRQTAWCIDRYGAESGHLLVFDQRPNKSWEERIFRRRERAGETPVTVWGM